MALGWEYSGNSHRHPSSIFPARTVDCSVFYVNGGGKSWQTLLVGGGPICPGLAPPKALKHTRDNRYEIDTG